MFTEPWSPLGLSLKVHDLGPAASVTVALMPAGIEGVDISGQFEELIW